MRRERQLRSHTFEARSELRRLQRQGKDKMRVAFVALLVIGFSAAVEIGRGYLAMQDVKNFANTIDTRSPAGVKAELQRFAKGLNDHNPFVRNASVTALKLATGWNLGPSAVEWRDFWAAHQADWIYHPETTAPPVNPVAPWKALLPPGATNALPAASNTAATASAPPAAR